MHINISEDILTDVLTHHEAWRNCLLNALHAKKNPDGSEADEDSKSYWQHEIRALDRLHLEVTRVLQPDQYQKRLELSTGKLVEDERAAPIRRPQLTVHVDDTIHLEPLTELAASCLRTWGSWWKIKQAMKSGKTWLLQSVSKQPRARKAKDVQVLEIHKTEDLGYVITKVVAFPEEFNYKKHHS